MGLENAYKQKTIATEAPQVPISESVENLDDLPKAMDKVVLVKEASTSETASKVEVGRSIEALLINDITLGQPIRFMTDKGPGYTGPVESFSQDEEGNYLFKTGASTWRVTKAA